MSSDQTYGHHLPLDILKIIASYAAEQVLKLSDDYDMGKIIPWYYLGEKIEKGESIQNCPMFVVDNVMTTKNINEILRELTNNRDRVNQCESSA